jgi:hypothetical protein
MNRTRMNATWHSRWLAATRAEELARRQEASTLLSFVATALLLATVAFWITLIAGKL